MIEKGNNIHKQKGVTLLESIVATAVIAIGFIAIFQMVNYSVQSIDISSERTKANYLVAMVAEDLIGNKNAAVESDTFIGKMLKGVGDSKRIAWKMPECKSEKDFGSAGTTIQSRKENKWNKRLSKTRMKCKSDKDHKHLYLYDICSDLVKVKPIPSCTFKNKKLHFLKSSGSEVMIIAKMEARLNNGKTKKVLFFQVD